MSARIRVVVVDDHQIVRVGLRQVLQEAPGIAVVAEVSDAQAGLAVVIRTRPDVAIIGSRVAQTDGPALVREIRSRCPETHCLVFAASTDEAALARAVMAGAAGCLLDDAVDVQVVDAVRRVAAGENLVPSRVVDQLRAREDEAVPRDRGLAGLTEQERRIARLIGRGCTNREIADALHLAEKTVRNYVSNVLAKLGMKNRTEVAVYVAEQRGVGRPEVGLSERYDAGWARAASMRAHPSNRISA